MKSIVESIQQINEGLCKNLYKIRKGHQVYVIGETGTKAILVTVKDVYRTRWDSFTSDNDTLINIELDDNPYVTQLGLLAKKGSDDELFATCNITYGGKGYVGTSKEAIQALRSSDNKIKIERLLNQLEEKQKELNKLMSRKQALEETISSEISESMYD